MTRNARQTMNQAVRLLTVGLVALAVLAPPFTMLYAVSYPLANILDYEDFVVPEQFLLEPNPVNTSRLCHLLANGSPLESRLTKGLWGRYQGPLAKAEFRNRFMTRQPLPECLPFCCRQE